MADTKTDSLRRRTIAPAVEMCIADRTSLLAPSVSEAQATAATAWPQDSLHHTSKPEALGGWQAAKDAPEPQGSVLP